jgi:D-amino-acid oxidase
LQHCNPLTHLLNIPGMWTVFDAPIEETGVLSDGTNKIWYDQLVGGLKHLSKDQLPKDAVFGLEFPTTFRINTAVYLYWYVNPPILLKPKTT